VSNKELCHDTAVVNNRHLSLNSIRCTWFIASSDFVCWPWGFASLEDLVACHCIHSILGSGLECCLDLFYWYSEEVVSILGAINRLLLDCIVFLLVSRTLGASTVESSISSGSDMLCSKNMYAWFLSEEYVKKRYDFCLPRIVPVGPVERVGTAAELKLKTFRIERTHMPLWSIVQN